MKKVCIIQARMGATRLPRKIMLKLHGKEMLIHVIERVLRSKKVDEIVIATTTESSDVEVEELIKKYNNPKTKVFRGSEEDVLDRYYKAAKESGADIVIRITGDCPLIDWDLIDKIITEFEEGDYDYVSNILSKRTYPRGLDVECFSFGVLEELWKMCTKQGEREHVTTYIRENKEEFRTKNIENTVDLSEHRWTVDEEKDFKFIKEVYDQLYALNKSFDTKDILDLLEKKPELSAINKYIEQKKSIENEAN